jgi:hypothetical protein
MSSRDGLEFISVTLGGGTTSNGLDSRFVDTKKLFDYAYDNFTLTKLKEKNSIIDTIEIENATKETKNLDLVIQDTITVFNNVNTDANEILPEIKLNENLFAPISQGEIVGSIKYTVDLARPWCPIIYSDEKSRWGSETHTLLHREKRPLTNVRIIYYRNMEAAIVDGVVGEPRVLSYTLGYQGIDKNGNNRQKTITVI